MAKGGKRPGAGAKKGKKHKATLEKEATLKAYTDRILKNADLILDGQLSNATGTQYLFKIEKKKIVGPKGGVRYEAQKPELVTSQFEIRDYIEGLLPDADVDDPNDPAATYYFITTEKPDNMAAKDMLDRAFGKALNRIAGADGGPLQVTVIKYAQRKK